MKTGLDVDNLVKQFMQVERLPMDALRKRIGDHEGRSTAWDELKTKTEALKDAAEALKTQATYAERSVTLSEETIATVTTTSLASTGSLDLDVSSLAASQRVESGVFSSNTTALGYSGTVIVDGASIPIVPEDTLESITNKIVLADIDATARIVKLASDKYKIVVTSTGTGVASALTYVDSAAATYSIDSSNPSVATASIAGDAAAGKYSVTVNALAQADVVQSDAKATRDGALGLAGTFSLNGANITALVTDSLDTLASTIDAANAGVSAAVVADGGNFRLRLTSTVSGRAGAISYTDPSGVLRGLGVLAGNLAVKNQVQAAADAVYTINGAAYTATSNTATTIPGVTVTLASAGTTDITVSASGGVLKSLGIMDSTDALAHETVHATDAAFTIDGYSFARSSNNITDAVPGLTITLKKTGSTTVEIAEAAETLLGKVKDFVAKWNEVVGSVLSKTKYDAKTKKAAILSGEILARDLAMKLRLTATKPVAGLITIDSLADIGIKTGTYGSADADKLVIDEEVLKEKLNSARTDVMKLFGAPTSDVPAPTDGIALKMFELTDSYVHFQTGFVPQRTTTITATIDSLQKQVGSWEVRLGKREAELYKKYSRMEVQLTRMQNQMSTLNKLI